MLMEPPSHSRPLTGRSPEALNSLRRLPVHCIVAVTEWRLNRVFSSSRLRSSCGLQGGWGGRGGRDGAMGGVT